MKLTRILSCLLALLFNGFCGFVNGQSGEFGYFENPVIYSDVPDVDIVRVDEDYYMVSTTAHMVPGAPIMHSKDLVHWEIISYVFTELKEGPYDYLNGGNIYGRGQWAASIRYHEGRFYVFFGTGNKSYLYSTDDPYGKWSLDLTLDRYYHDASLLFDDNGRIYLAYGSSHIKIVELEKDLSGIRKDGLNIEVIHGEPKGLLEGTHFYKIGGMYYLLLIWWPENGIRTQLCFRSRDIEGPYEEKVILSDDLDFPGNGVAQGGLLNTKNGRWFAMLFQDHGAVGRVPVLVQCRWDEGWPILGNSEGKVDKRMECPLKSVSERHCIVSSDEFDSDSLDVDWQWNHNPDDGKWSLSERRGFLRLRTGKICRNLFEARNTLTQRTMGPDCSGYISLDVSKMRNGDHAGLSAFCSEAGCVSVIMDGGRKFLVMSDRGEEKERIVLSSDKVMLKVSFDFRRDDAKFHYSLDGQEWIPIGDSVHMVFSMAHFTGYKFAIFNYATSAPGGYVDVDYFRYQGPEGR